MRSDKRNRAINQYNGHKGPATIAHVEGNLLASYPRASQELSGRQYGQVMSACNTSYQDGSAHATVKGEVWDYCNPTDWVAGIGTRESDGRGGYRNPLTVEARGNTITITHTDGTVKVYTSI